jgi:hypothetical protein
MKQEVMEQHLCCQLSVRWKSVKNKTTPRPGLFCKDHNTYLDWLTDQMAYELIDVDHIPVEPWVDKKKAKPQTLPRKKGQETLRQKRGKWRKAKRIPLDINAK